MISVYIVEFSNGTKYGPFETAEKASEFIQKVYRSMSGAARIECIWTPPKME